MSELKVNKVSPKTGTDLTAIMAYFSDRYGLFWGENNDQIFSCWKWTDCSRSS